MQRIALVFSLLFGASLAFGQVESNSITVSVSRNTNLQPDQVVFAVTVQSGLGASLDDVLAAVQGAGITMANFSGVNTTAYFVVGGFSTATLGWTFNLAVPFAKMKDTVASLTALQQSINQNTSGLALSFTVQGTQVSAQLAQSQTCSYSGLFADAQAQAQTLAAAAGVSVGQVLALSSSAASTSSVTNAALSSFLLGASAPPCTMTVKFSLLRYQ
ncbi:MAG TPA: hypothetical protein VMH80_09265 [Bryobacteraceae bacterium]|nr:hypothetical protein [Bryobacteraceae bacterium]